MQIDNVLSKYQLVPLVFAEDAVAAAQNDVQLKIMDTGTAQLNDSYTMPFAGEVIGIGYNLNAAATVGSLTLGPTIDGTECTDPTLTVTTGTGSSDICRRTTNPFAKDAKIGAEMTSSADWNGTASDLVVVVWVLLKVTGI